MKNRHNGVIKYIVLAVFGIILMMIPFPADDLFIRFELKESVPGDYRLYYMNMDQLLYDEDHLIIGSLNDEGNIITFRLDPSLEGNIRNLRLDLPAEENVLCFSSVTASSAGVIKKRWSVPDIFAQSNMIFQNNASVQSIPSREITYVQTGADDPFIIFADNIASELTSYYSHKVLTRICVIGLILIGMILYDCELFKNS